VRSLRNEAPAQLTLFFYGTLKRGHANHNLFCSGYSRVEEATVRGRLYRLPSGYPALVVPEEDIHASGTANPIHDTSEQQRLHHAGVYRSEGTVVLGELFVFDDPEERLPALDRLEGFDPSRSSLYRRVLIPAEICGGASVLAWAYVIEESSGTHLPGGRWPPWVGEKG
jgi:gamma-glutamylcyclotransferase (GGCT)/AIG2-like uncharacterized protein YtfP